MLGREFERSSGSLCGGWRCDRVWLSGGVGVRALRRYVGVGVDDQNGRGAVIEDVMADAAEEGGADRAAAA